MTQPTAARRPFDDRRAAPTREHVAEGSHLPSESARELLALVASARVGDNRAWEALVARLTPMLRSIARSYRLPSHDIDDVVQTTWMRLVTDIGRLRDPGAVAGWLATTLRRECLRLLQQPVREVVTDDVSLGDGADAFADPEHQLLAAEQRVALRRALDTLPERHRRLMTLLVAQPGIDYGTVSVTLGMPRGSIGPIRARSLTRLQSHPELRSLSTSATQ